MSIEKGMAVLIDADNVSDKYIKFIFEELSSYPEKVTVKRIYGDWTSPRLASWKSVLLEYSITPVQQYSYTTGKNATDSALIIDAMDILYGGSVGAFCIVSSDSDFTRLAARLRESGMSVIGMGERKTPKPFITACETFKYLEVISQEEQPAPQTSKDLIRVTTMVRKFIDENSDDDGFIFLGKVGNYLKKTQPDFDTRNFGCRTLTQFITKTGKFVLETRTVGGRTAPLSYIANK